MLRRTQGDAPKGVSEDQETANVELARQMDLIATQLETLVERVIELRGKVDGISVLLNYIVPPLVGRDAVDRDATLEHLRTFIRDGRSFLGTGFYAQGVISEYTKMEKGIRSFPAR